MVGTWDSSSVSLEDTLIEEGFKNLFEKQPWLVRHSFTPEYWSCKEQVMIDICNNTITPNETTQPNVNKRKYREGFEHNTESVNSRISQQAKQSDFHKKIRVLSDLGDEIYNSRQLSSNPLGESYSLNNINNIAEKKPSETSQLPNQFVNLRLQSTPIFSSTFSTPKNQSSESSSTAGHSPPNKNESSEALSSSFKMPYSRKDDKPPPKVTCLNIFNFEQSIYDPHFNPLLWNQELVDRLANNGWFDNLFYSSKSKSLLRDNALWNHYVFDDLSLSTQDASTLTVLFLSNSFSSSLNYVIEILQKKGITCNMKKVEFGSKSTKKIRNYDIKERKSEKGKSAENNESKSKLPTISSTKVLYLIFPQEPDQDIINFQSKAVRLFLKKFQTINKIHIWETRDDCIINFENLYKELRLTRELETKLYQVKRHYWNHMKPLKEWKIMNSIVNFYNREIESLSKVQEETISNEGNAGKTLSSEVGHTSNIDGSVSNVDESVSKGDGSSSSNNEVESILNEVESTPNIGESVSNKEESVPNIDGSTSNENGSNITSISSEVSLSSIKELSEVFIDPETRLSEDNSLSEYERISLSLRVQHSLIFFKEDVVEKLARIYPPTNSSIFKNNWKIKCPYVLLQSEAELFELKNISESLNNFTSPCGGIGTIVHMRVVSKTVIQGRFYGLRVKSALVEDWWLLDQYRTLPEFYIEPENASRRRPFILMLAYDMNVVDWSIVNLPSIVYDEIEWENIPRDKQIFVEGYIGVKFEICDNSGTQEVQEI